MERKYALTRVTAGDYIFPANDGTTLLRVNRYIEDGSAEVSSADGKSWRKLTGTFWSARRYPGTLDEAEALMHHDPDEFLNWDRWREIVTTLPTRAEAITEALRFTEVAAMREP